MKIKVEHDTQLAPLESLHEFDHYDFIFPSCLHKCSDIDIAIIKYMALIILIRMAKKGFKCR